MADHPIDVLARAVAARLSRRRAARMALGACLAAIGDRIVHPRLAAATAQSDCGGTTPDQCQVALTLVCVDLTTDDNHCGACGNVCEAGTRCVSSECLSADEPTPSESSESEPFVDATGTAATVDGAVVPDVDRSYESPQFGYRLSWRTPWEADGEAQSIAGLGDTFRLVAGEMIFRAYIAEATDLEPGAVIARNLERAEAETPDLTVIEAFDVDQADPRQITRFDLDGMEYERTLEAVALMDPSGVLTIETRYPTRVSPDYVRAIDAAVTLELQP